MGKKRHGQAKTARFVWILRGAGAVLGLGIVLFLAAAIYQDANRPGRLVFPTDSVDLGQVPTGKQVLYRFTMRNDGGKPVTITKKSMSALEGC